MSKEGLYAAGYLMKSSKDLNSDEDSSNSDDDLFFDAISKPREDLDVDEDLSSDEDLDFDGFFIVDEVEDPAVGYEEHLNTTENSSLLEDVNLDKDVNSNNSPHSEEDVKKTLIQYKRQHSQYKEQLVQCKTELMQRQTQLTQRTELDQREDRLLQYRRHLAKWQRKLDKREEKLAETTKTWKQDRKVTINLLRQLADEIQKHEDNTRVATLAGTSTSIVGTCIAVGGILGSVLTLGISPIVTFVGVALSASGGVAVMGADLVNSLLRSSNTKLVDEALKRDKEATHELENEMNETQKILTKVTSSLSKISLISKTSQMAVRIGRPTAAGLKTGMLLGKCGCQGGNTAFKALGAASKAAHVGGIVFGAITLIGDVHRLVSTSVEVHNGAILKVVEDIRQAAQKLEDELNVYEDEQEAEI